jgi:hypothetical protein
MSDSPNFMDELRELTAALHEDNLTAQQEKRLEELVVSDVAARRIYIQTMFLFGKLHRIHAGGETGKAAVEKWEAGSPESELQIPNSELPFIVVGPSPLSPLPPPLFSLGGLLFSYMLSAVILGVAILGAWTCKISHVYQQVVEHRQQTPKDRPGILSESDYVGWVTGMKNCRWANPDTEILLGASVPSDRKFALSAGLLEITYKTGAKILLQGPCTFKVEFPNGGYLSRGKLTARVESGELRVGRNAEGGKRKAEEPLPNSRFFTIRTPTAVITDLGTEFGIEVDENGVTESHVKQGKVDVKTIDPQSGKEKHARVAEGNAVRIDPKSGNFVSVSYSPDRFAEIRKGRHSREEEAYIQAVLADKPLGYWPLNEPAGSRKFFDRSVNGYHGSAMRTVLAGLDGPFPGPSQAVAFNGNGYIDIGRKDRFALASLTIEAWVWIEGLRFVEGDSNHARIISVGSGETRYQRSGWAVGYAIESANNPPSISFSPFHCKSGSAFFRNIETPYAHWIHFAYAYDADRETAQVILNGKLQGSVHADRSFLGPTWVAIGWCPHPGGEYWRGRLAHVAVYPATLNEAQIETHFRCSQKQQNAGGGRVVHPSDSYVGSSPSSGTTRCRHVK